MKKLIFRAVILATVCIMLVCGNLCAVDAFGLTVCEPVAEDYVSVDSEYMSLATSQVEYVPSDIIRVTIDPEALNHGIVEAVISLPRMPLRLDCVYLSEGWHLARGIVADIIDEHHVKIIVETRYLKDFYQLHDVYMVFISAIYPET